MGSLICAHRKKGKVDVSAKGQISDSDPSNILMVRQIISFVSQSRLLSLPVRFALPPARRDIDMEQHALDDFRGSYDFMAPGRRHVLHARGLCTRLADSGCDRGAGQDYSRTKDSLVIAEQKI